MTSELLLRRKWTFRAHGKQVVFVKKPVETVEHVLMKAFLWALYLPDYLHLTVEIRVGDRYKPDVVAMTESPYEGRKPAFWGEAGQVSEEKIRALVKRYRSTHFAITKWDTPLHPFVKMVSTALDGLERSAPFDLLNFPPDSAERFIGGDGQIRVRREEVEWVRV